MNRPGVAKPSEPSAIPHRDERRRTSQTAEAGPGPLTHLRGAGVDVDIRLLGRVIAGICLLSVAGAAAALFVAGADKNAQITTLRHDGVPIAVTVSSCMGQLSGSGTNGAGYSCRGTFVLDGRRYSVAIPGDALRSPRSKVRAVAARSDPALVETAANLASERASWRVFILPTVLVVVLVLLLGGLARKRRSARPDRAARLRAGA